MNPFSVSKIFMKPDLFQKFSILHSKNLYPIHFMIPSKKAYNHILMIRN